jgi:hypothetical protein
MRTLVYKMTHIGDPSPATGVWGDTGCMGIVRGYEFDAVVGIGGTSAWDGIACKITQSGTVYLARSIVRSITAIVWEWNLLRIFARPETPAYFACRW